jgi:hypothetical protein
MAKHSGIKLPKRLAGIKIPKAVRKGPLGQFLNSHAGQVILAEAVVAAAAVFTASKTDEDSPVAEGLRHPAESARHLGQAMAMTSADHSERLAHAFHAAGRAFREALRESYHPAWRDERATAAETGGDDDEAAHAKKKSSDRSHDTRH